MRRFGIVLAATAAATALSACGGSAAPQSVEIVEIVEIVDVIREVQYYPGCSNEPVAIDDMTWYPLADWAFPDEVADIEATTRQDPVEPVGFASPRVAAPGQGDDTGTLVVYADDVARYETDNGLVIWLTRHEQTYDWVC